MADAVHFGTWDDQADTTKSSGFNGFTAPFKDQSASVGNVYNNIVSFAQTIKLFWRVRRWTVTSGSLSFFLGGFSTTILAPGVIGGPAAAREIDLIQQGIAYRLVDDEPRFTLFIFDGALRPNIKLDGTDLRPAIEAGGIINESNGSDSVLIHYTQDASAITPTGSFTITLDGIVVTIYYEATLAGDGAFTFDNLVVDPVEFWPYAATDGSPIFNTTTGAQLQDENN